MPRNSIEKYMTNVQNQLDQHIVATAKTGWMEPNSSIVQYTGGRYVEMPTMSTDGLANYDRDKGFVEGGINIVYNRYELGQDRGRSFLIDRMDNDETAFVLSVANAMKVFQSSQVIPEIDSYRYSKLAALAIAAGKTLAAQTVTADSIWQKLRNDLGVIEDIYGEEADIVITMSGATKRILESSTEWQRKAGVIEFPTGGANLKSRVSAINDHPILTAPLSRLKTKYVFNDGKTVGQEKGGFKADESALDINWLITLRKAPIAINKTDKIRIFDPDTNQTADAWKFDYRKYHELWVLKSLEDAIFVNTAPKN